MCLLDFQALDDRFTSLPAQAVECSLANISPANNADIWSDEAVATFEEVTFDKKLLLVPLEKTAEGRHVVILSCDGVDVACELVSRGLAQDHCNTVGKVLLYVLCPPTF